MTLDEAFRDVRDPENFNTREKLDEHCFYNFQEVVMALENMVMVASAFLPNHPIIEQTHKILAKVNEVKV